MVDSDAALTYRTFDKKEDENEVEEEYYTVDSAVEKIGFGNFQLKLIFITGVFSMSDAFEMLLLSVLSPVLHCEWNLDYWHVAFITTVVFIGMFVGAPMWGTMCDRFGRRPILIIVAVLIFYYGFLTSFSPNITWVMILRCLVGLSIAGGSFGFTYLTEYLPFKYRAKILTVHQIFWALGSMIEVLMASIIVPTLGWRWLVFFSSLPILFSAVLLYFFVPESARYLVAAGRRDEAQKLLHEIAATNNSTLPPGRLVQDSATERGSLLELFVPEYRRTTLSLAWTWFGAAFTYYGMVLASSEIHKFQVNCGPVTVPGLQLNTSLSETYSCPYTCQKLSSDDYYTMMVSSLGEFLIIPVNFFMLDLLGRRRAMAANCLGATIFFLLLQVCTTRQIISFISLGIRAFCTGIFLANYIYTTEVYPTTMRSLGLGVNSAMARIGAMLTPFIAQVLLDVSPMGTIYVYATVSLSCSIVAVLLPIETKGREMPQTVSAR